MGNLLLECFAGSGEAKINSVLFLPCLSHTLRCHRLIEGSGVSMSGKSSCSISDSVSVVSQMNQTISRKDAGELE